MTVITDYTLNPTAKTITLGSDFVNISIEQILYIRNLTKNILIYDSGNPRKRNSSSGIDISVSSGVISYVETHTMEATDNILILANIDPNSLNVPVNLFSSESVSASSTATVAASVYTGQLSKLSVYCSNSGASTDCTVTIYASPTSSLTGRKKALAVFTLGAGNVTVYEAGKGIDPRQLDNYIWATITNNDSVNAAVVTVTLSMFR